METKKLAQVCLDEFGGEHQRMLMVEEMLELGTTLCHYLRGRRVSDKVQEELADCYAVLDQMDIVFGLELEVSKSVIPIDPDIKLFLRLSAVLQGMLLRSVDFEGEYHEKLILFRLFLDELRLKFGAKGVEKWYVEKQERMVRRLKARGVEMGVEE